MRRGARAGPPHVARRAASAVYGDWADDIVLTVDGAAVLTPDADPLRSQPPADALRDVLRRRPGWPVVLLFVGYPLWWALGVTDLVGLVATVAMAGALARRPHTRVPRGFGVLLLFLVWVALSFALIQIAAPGAVATPDSKRYLTAAWRLLWYLEAVVLLLYLGNERERLRQAWICRTLGWMFVWAVAGGLLGVIAPSFQFRSLAERLLPHGLISTPFVYAKVHPVAAERFADFLGGAYRTSAPFPYSNIWGLNVACFLPFFVVGWLSRDAGRRRRLTGWLVLGASVVPIVLSLNRGLWLALAAIVALLAIRAAVAGQLRLVAVLAAGAVLAGTVLALSPLGALVEHRLSGTGLTSAQTRSHLVSVTLSSVRHESPVLGFGATRDLAGNFSSIAGGATSSCRRCSPPAIGTQGQLLLVTFTQGLVGAVLYFGFLLTQFLRGLRTPSRYATAGLAVLLAHLVTAGVYSADNVAILPIFAAVALLWRAGAAQRIRDASGQRFALDEPEVAMYSMALGRHWKPVLSVVVACLLAGIAFAVRAGPVYRATESIYVAPDPSYPSPRLSPLPASLDSVARSAAFASALEAMRRAAGGRHVRAERSRLSVTATRNSRVLHVTYAGPDPSSARTLASAAAAAMLRTRAADLDMKQRQVIAQLTGQVDAIDAVMSRIRAAATRAGQPGAVRIQLAALETQLRDKTFQLSTIRNIAPDPGRELTPTSVVTSRDQQLRDAANGLALGVLTTAGLLLLLRFRNPYVAALSGEVAGVPLIWRGPLPPPDVYQLVRQYRPEAAVAAGADGLALQAAAGLDAAIPVRNRGNRRVIVTVATTERVNEVRRALSRLGDAQVVGVVAVNARHRGRSGD